eukprot:TRINITY_DN711_c0_g2_i16.p1 TRINITY_DN711_c0_g2~~TRINITY_DN711_c0_g2_i16.p1  ORF type:complete len:111 (-),score=10.03 TRINITY_DN711_c0_g2_i16:61-393(-)
MEPDWTPHLTLYKRTRKTSAKLRMIQKTRSREGDPAVLSSTINYKEFINKDFGTQVVGCIELLSMEGAHSDYPCYANLVGTGINKTEFELHERFICKHYPTKINKSAKVS